MAFVSVSARRERASGRGVWFALPGLDGGLVQSWYHPGGVVDLLKVVQGDTESLAAAEIVNKRVIGLCGLGLVTLC